MLHGVDGILVLYRRVVEAAVLPDWVVRPPDRHALLVGDRPLYVLATRDLEVLYPLRRGVGRLLSTVNNENRDEGADEGYEDPSYHYETERYMTDSGSHLSPAALPLAIYSLRSLYSSYAAETLIVVVVGVSDKTPEE
jgi:hypothetical protein